MVVGKVLRVTINFLKNGLFQFSHKIEKHSLKQVKPIRYTTEKKCVAAVTFEDFPVACFWREHRKSVVYFGLHEFSLHF